MHGLATTLFDVATHALNSWHRRKWPEEASCESVSQVKPPGVRKLDLVEGMWTGLLPASPSTSTRCARTGSSQLHQYRDFMRFSTCRVYPNFESSVGGASSQPANFPGNQMTDNKNLRGQPDRSLVNMHEAYEVEYWTKRLGVSKQRLQQAVSAVGNSAAKVEAWLKANR
jgi:hypothetical protein